jgi:hypothetical protein
LSASIVVPDNSFKKTMAEAVLSALLGVLFDRMASTDLPDFARQEGLEEKLDKWRKMLSRIEAVLDDAEEKKQDNGRAAGL